MSLRSRILLLVLLSTLAPALLFCLNLFENRNAQIATAKEGLNTLAAYAAESLDNKVSGAVQLLYGLSRAPDLDTSDKNACSAFLGAVLERYPQFTGLLTIGPDGQLRCDSLRSGRKLDLNDRGYFKQAKISTEPAFEVVFGRLTGVAVQQIAYPVRDDAGKLKYVLLASLNLAQFAERLAMASGQTGMAVLIWDSAGVLMVRHPDDGPRKFAGTAQSQSSLYQFIRTAKSGETAELSGPDGVMKIWAAAALPAADGTGLRISLGLPRDVLLAEANKDLYQASGVFAGVSLLAFICAVLFAEFGIRRPVARIGVAAARHEVGDYVARIGPPYPRGELGGLMVKLDAAADSVQAQQIEIGRKSKELRRINRTLRMLSAINSTIVRVHNRNDLLEAACRVAAEEGQFPIAWVGMLDPVSRKITPVAWQGVDQAYADAAARSMTESEDVVAVTLRGGRAVIVNDIAGEPRLVLRETALERGSRALVAFPLIVFGEVAGVFVLHASEVGFFDEEEMKLLNELAGDIAFALEYIVKSEKLDYLAYHDSVTGVANRALFCDRLEDGVANASRQGGKIALVLLDVERFKTINDAFGRVAGDALLRELAVRLSEWVAGIGRIARIDADHFAVLLMEVQGKDGAAQLIQQRAEAIFNRPFRVGEAEVTLSAKFGIALFPDDGVDADMLLRNAEAALKNAKAGGERYVFYTVDMNEHVAKRLTLENKLRLAIEREEFVLYYQPKVEMDSRRIVGVEALIRWRTPDLGLLEPIEFIPLLEETGMILQVGAWAFRQAKKDYEEWRELAVKPPRIAINVSPTQFHRRDFVSNLAELIGKGGGESSGLDLQVTESLLMEDVESSILKLGEIRSLGLHVAIDRFGTGYSSLGHLARLPVQTLKIDRSFVATMMNSPQTMAMVYMIISLAHSLRLTAVAVGVDADDQAKTLRLIGCDQMQGFLFSPPIPKAELLRLLQNEKKA